MALRARLNAASVGKASWRKGRSCELVNPQMVLRLTGSEYLRIAPNLVAHSTANSFSLECAQ